MVLNQKGLVQYLDVPYEKGRGVFLKGNGLFVNIVEKINIDQQKGNYSILLLQRDIRCRGLQVILTGYYNFHIGTTVIFITHQIITGSLTHSHATVICLLKYLEINKGISTKMHVHRKGHGGEQDHKGQQ